MALQYYSGPGDSVAEDAAADDGSADVAVGSEDDDLYAGLGCGAHTQDTRTRKGLSFL